MAFVSVSLLVFLSELTNTRSTPAADIDGNKVRFIREVLLKFFAELLVPDK